MLNLFEVSLNFHLRKHQILRNKKEISYLFEAGKPLFFYPLKYYYQLIPQPSEKTDRFKILIIVPKKKIKQSSLRNKIKRQIKEHFRLSQHNLIIPSQFIYHIAFIYNENFFDENIKKEISTSIQSAINYFNKHNEHP